MTELEQLHGRAGACRSCSAPVVWTTTIAGKSIPLDPDPHPDGNVVPDGTRVRVLTDAEMPATTPAWRAHWTTCPHANQHRRRTHPTPPADLTTTYQPATDDTTPTVRVVRLLDHDAPDGPTVRAVTITTTCPTCGRPRGTPHPLHIHDHTTHTHHVIDRWTNPCRHIDLHTHLLTTQNR